MKKLIALIVSLCMLMSMLPAMAETATEAPAETEKVDMNRLIDQIVADMQNAVVRVDLEDMRANSTVTPGANGSVFTVLKAVLTDAAEALAKQGKENEDLNKLLALINDPEKAKTTEEKEFELLSALAILGLKAEVEDAAAEVAVDTTVTMAVANNLLKTVVEACKANEALAAAVKATDSRLFEMLEENNKHIKEYVEKNGVLDVVMVEVDEKSYEEFEAEIKKLEDYLNGTEGQKQSALDLLNLLHAVMDDVHEAIDGHAHDAAKEVDHYALVGEMLNDLMEAISKVNLDEIREKGGENFNTTGSVYAVLEKVVNNVMADEAIKEKEVDEKLAVILETIGGLAEMGATEEEAEAVFATLMASDEELKGAKEVDPEVDFLRSSHILKATYDTMMENEVITAALEATNSRLPEMLVNTGEKLKNYLKENKTLHEVKDVDEAPFIAFEAEFAKLRDHIAGLEDGTVGKAKALGVLDLLHEYVDDIHQAVDGHVHEEAAK